MSQSNNKNLFWIYSPTELKLELKEKKDDEYMGYILLQCTLVPKSGEEKEVGDWGQHYTLFCMTTVGNRGLFSSVKAYERWPKFVLWV